MARYCESCGAEIGAGSFFCQNCGAPVPQSGAAEAAQAPYERRRVTTPRTIAELEAFCDRHELPLAKMRFFIGLDYPGAKAFGIYRDGDGNFVVYKNKADGSRAIRYEGPDEAHAVNEILQKLQSEVELRRQKKGVPTRKQKKTSVASVIMGVLLTVVVSLFIAIGGLVFRRSGPSRGYYYYDDDYYYYQNDEWYRYDNEWYPAYVDETLEDNYGDYWVEDGYDDVYGVAPFSDSEYYQEYDDSDWDDWDDDWGDDDWDDWDTDDTDWDSDW